MLDQLINRWEKAFDEIKFLSQYRDAAKTFKYASEPAYELKKYTRSEFQPLRQLSTTASNDLDLSFKYGFSAAGLPCYVSFPNNGNTSNWEGYYNYAEDLIEYLEFNLETRIPSIIERITLSDGRMTSFQRIAINTRASAPGYIDMERKEVIDRVTDINTHSIQAQIEQYEYADDRIIRADCTGIFPGPGRYDFQKIYTYNEAGELDEVRDISPDGTSRLSYVRPDDHLATEELLHQLTVKIAESIVNTLIKSNVETPVAIVRISYQYVYSYRPVISAISGSGKNKAVSRRNAWEELFLGFDTLLYPEIATFERLFVQFEQLMEATSDFEMGRTMLRKTAALLTTSRLLGRIPVSEEFLAYAIDNSVEGHEKEDLKDILRDCGMKEDIIKAWDERRWLRP